MLVEASSVSVQASGSASEVASDAYDAAASAGGQAYDAAADTVDQLTRVLSNYNSKAQGASKSITDAASASTQASFSWLKVGHAINQNDSWTSSFASVK